MSFTIAKAAFLTVIQKAAPVVPTRTSLQVLYNFKITIKDGVFEVIASDLDNFVKATCRIDGNEFAEIAVNAKKLYEIATVLDDEAITLDIRQNTLFIESASGYSCSILGVDIREFPHFPENEYSQPYTIDLPTLKNLVTKSSFAVSKDESRACLCGVLWETSSQKIGMVATDGHRLGASFQNIETGVEDDISIIVSQKSLLSILKTAELEGVDTVNYTIADKHIVFSTSQFTLSTKTIDGPYPDYQKGIPKEFSKSVVINRLSFLQAVRRVSVLSNKKTQLIKCAFSDDTIVISAMNKDINGEAQQILPAKYEGDADHSIGFNGSYLSEILSIISTESIRIEMNSQVSAAVLFPEYTTEDTKISDDVFLIMPLRIFE